MSKILVLKKKLGALWYLEVENTGIIITGPHRWGNDNQAMKAAQAFASTWGLRVMTGEEYGAINSGNKDPVS